MKKITACLLCVIVLFSMCSCNINPMNNQEPTTTVSENHEYMIITQIDHCAVEPDDKLHMSDEDEEFYRKLMDAMLSQEDSVKLSDDSSKNEYYLDLLKQSPYFFFVKKYEMDKNKVNFTYKYEKTEQDKKLKFIDEKFLDIVNSHADKDDNTLDRILNIHSAVAHGMTYDHARTDNKQLDSPLFQYPADEIYKGLKTGKSLCYGFAYTLRFAFLQAGIDCFCVYGPCRYHGEGHMWNIFKYDGEFFTCDSAWDRSDDGYAQLAHFGKTEKERKVDTLSISGYSSTFFEEYGEITCTDERFKIFRNIDRYSIYDTHQYYLVDFEQNNYMFNTETFTIK